jgi:hypothetical protein
MRKVGPEAALQLAVDRLNAVRRETAKVIVGQDAVVEGDLIYLLASGHLLLEGVPELGKTTLLRTLARAETAADFDRASNERVDYHFSHDVEEPGPKGSPLPDIFVFGPDGFRAPLKVGKVATGHYRGRLAIGQNQGRFRVRPLAESRTFPEVGFYRQEDEMREYGNNEALLRQIAAATGGRFNPAPREVFDAGGRSIRSTMELWPGLIALAIALNLAELILRKWKGVLEALRPRTAAA